MASLKVTMVLEKLIADVKLHISRPMIPGIFGHALTALKQTLNCSKSQEFHLLWSGNVKTIGIWRIYSSKFYRQDMQETNETTQCKDLSTTTMVSCRRDRMWCHMSFEPLPPRQQVVTFLVSPYRISPESYAHWTFAYVPPWDLSCWSRLRIKFRSSLSLIKLPICRLLQLNLYYE